MRNHLATNIFKLDDLLKKNIEFNIVAGKIKKYGEALIEPLNVMIMGKFSTGKSTFINAMLGRDVANTSAIPTTAVITKFSYGDRDRIIAHFKGGTTQEFSIADFNALTSEVEGKSARLRKDISYVERQLNIDLLKKYTFWDSPGLDATVKGHAEITQDFIDNADGILWLFSIDQAGSKVEMDILSRLNSRLKPIALVNKIDMADDDDEIEEILDDLRLKFRDKVITVEGISAALAQEGRKKDKANFIEESNIDIADKLLDRYFYSKVDYLKVESFLKDMSAILPDFANVLGAYNRSNFNYRNALETEHDSYIESACTSYKQDMVKYRNLLEYNEKIRDTINGINFDLKNIISKVEMPSSNAAYRLLTQFSNDIWNEFYKMVGTAFCSACHGDAKSQYELGERLQRDWNKAVYWYQLAGNQEYLPAIKVLYSNLSHPRYWFEKAANMGDKYAILQCGLNYYTGNEHFDKNNEKAVYWLEKAAIQNIDNTDIAQYYLGCMYEKGIVVNQDYGKAYNLFSSSASMHNKNSISKVAECLYYGNGIQENKLDAFYKWRDNKNYDLVKQYFVDDNFDLHRTIALDYSKDIFSSDNYYSKIWWLELDFLHNENVISAYDCGILYSNSQKYDDALSWHEKAVQKGYAPSMNSIGNIYYENYNKKLKSIPYYMRAILKGDMKYLGRVVGYFSVRACQIATVYILLSTGAHLMYSSEVDKWNEFIEENEIAYTDKIENLRTQEENYKIRGLHDLDEYYEYDTSMKELERIIKNIYDEKGKYRNNIARMKSITEVLPLILPSTLFNDNEIAEITVSNKIDSHFYDTRNAMRVDKDEIEKKMEEEKEAAANRPSERDINVRSDMSLGGIQLGDKMSNVQDMYGRPNKIDENNVRERWYYDDIQVVFDKKGMVTALVSETKRVSTKRGFHQGTNLNDIIKSYGDSTMKYEDDSLMVYEYQLPTNAGVDGLLRYAINKSDKKVNYISVRIPEEWMISNDDVDNAGDVFIKYHKYISDHKMNEAYNLLSPQWKNHMGTLGDFSRGYENTLTSRVDEVKAISTENGKIVYEYKLIAKDRARNGVLVQIFQGKVTMVKVDGNWRIGETESRKVRDYVE